MTKLKFNADGLLTGVAQDVRTGKVLMVAMMNLEAVKLTQQTRKAHFWSRSRNKLWMKGETSGNILDIKEIKIDCDGDALLLLAEPRGPACHTGNESCFYSNLEKDHVI